jgi:hypothetical protein
VHDNTLLVLLCIMNDLAYFMHCIILLLVHIWLLYPFGHVYAEPELEVQAKQAQVEAITSLDQDKPRFI